MVIYIGRILPVSSFLIPEELTNISSYSYKVWTQASYEYGGLGVLGGKHSRGRHAYPRPEGTEGLSFHAREFCEPEGLEFHSHAGIPALGTEMKPKGKTGPQGQVVYAGEALKPLGAQTDDASEWIVAVMIGCRESRNNWLYDAKVTVRVKNKTKQANKQTDK